ncbi:antitoxin Xre-like helix-turn-helix domain-containing protein [uncultured Boseongicola sp.]|jgi:plasmid maintenance system antidote protein VapI|uniref:MbcA/ParS/Xre antitoxin family protein n=1 Tax=uncultured Boseongicola sp. TaxID=1648499 RepID=UPI00261568E9|nr:antitoxin Xre-like helix-turn-helix domain-containing protein [uncultured Boseongicola sp.]
MNQASSSPQFVPGAVLGKSVFRASQALGLSGAELATVIGVSPSSVSRLNDGQYKLSGKPFELAACLVRVFRSLDAIVHGDGTSMKAWMVNQNTHLNSTPKDEVKSAQGLVRVMNYLDAARAPI